MLLHKLGYTTCLVIITFIRFYFRFPVLWLLCYTYSCPAFPLMFYFSSFLLLSYHTMNIPCLVSFAVYLLALTCLCSRHDFQCIFMTWIYRYTCAYLSTLSDFRIAIRRGVLTPLDPLVKVSELRACGFSQLLIRVAQLKHGSPADCLEPYPSRPPARL